MKLIDFIVCDDVRQEVGNKPSLMGVYTNLVLAASPDKKPPVWPFPLRLGFFIRCQIEADEVKSDFFRIEFILNGEIFSHVEGTASIPDDTNMFSIVVVNNAFQIQGTGAIHFRIIFKKSGELIQEIEPDYFLYVEVAPD